MNNPLAILTAALALAAPLAGAQQTGKLPPLPKDAKVSITFYNYNLASAGIGAEGTKQLIAEFQALYPNITVEGVPAPSDQVLARLQADVVARRTPDVAQIVFADMEFAVRNLGVKALEDLIPERELAAHFVGMHPRGRDLGRLEGKTWGVPYVFSTPVLFYNADLFRQAGLDPNRPPRTWAEVKAYALQIKNRTQKAGFFPAVYSPFDWMWQSFALSFGGRVMSQDRKQLTFADDAAMGAVRMLRDLVDSGAHPNITAADAQAAMTAGNLGMYLQTSALQNFLLSSAKGKFDLRSAQMPGTATSRLSVPVNSGSGVFILSNDPLKQRASWELIKFLTSNRGYTIITSKIGYVPLREEAVRSEQFLAPWLRDNPIVRPNLEQLNRLSPWVPIPGPNYKQVTKLMMDALEQAVLGRDDPATVMKAAQERAQALMPR